MLVFETELLATQLRMENAFARLADLQDKPVALIFDRGTMDVGAYLPAGLWREVLRLCGETETSLLSRYDVVLHFRTVAAGSWGEALYRNGNTEDDCGVKVFRTSTPDQAVVKDARSEMIWQAHPNVHLLENTPDFQGKLDVALTALRTFAHGEIRPPPRSSEMQ